MRTYWLHSIWVLGFFLSLFSLQGKGVKGFQKDVPSLMQHHFGETLGSYDVSEQIFTSNNLAR